MRVSMILCVDKNNGLGKNNNIPWKSKLDMSFFKKTTIGNNKNVVLMGFNTFKSIGLKPLKDRMNIVLTKNNYSDAHDNLIYFKNVDDVLLFLHANNKRFEELFIIGGNQIYKKFLELKIISTIYLNIIDDSYDCDCSFDTKNIEYNYQLVSSFGKVDHINDKYVNVFFKQYKFINRDENKYLDLMKYILGNGAERLDRTGAGTLSTFGEMIKYDVRNGTIPLLTTKRMFFRGIVEELLFFVSGKTDTKILEDKNVNIWKGNTSREFLDSRGLHEYREGDMGPMYSFQLRHWGAEYKTCDDDYTGKGYDQLENVIYLIKNDPTSRRILFSYWNPVDFQKTPIPCCHILYQFDVDTENNELSLAFYCRSQDYCLGTPFNIASATVLLNMVCYLTNYKPSHVSHFMGNVHIYKPFIEPFTTQTKREPYPFPKLLIKPINKIEKIEDFKYEDFKLVLYSYHPAIKADMIA